MTPWTVVPQAPLSMEFSRQEYWSRLSCPPPGDLPNPGIEPESLALAGGFFTTAPPGWPMKVYACTKSARGYPPNIRRKSQMIGYRVFAFSFFFCLQMYTISAMRYIICVIIVFGLKKKLGDFPNGPVAKTELPMQGARVQSLVRELELTSCN